jgi:UDP-N-acetylglucosamine--N-acetylmuramyl-(pentapeptide) pyrophosphoryl-undecaprenol N-acetylglucosamine transferase
MRLLIAAGGTGGHIYPALAVASALRRQPEGASVDWLGGRRGLESALVPAAGIQFHSLALRSLRSVELDRHLVLDPIRLALSVPEALWRLLRRRPDAIFTTGGYVAIPVLLAAALLRVPTLLWEGNVIPGRSSRLVARLASAVAVSFEATCRALGRRPCYETGTPIRHVAPIDRPAAREALGIPADGRLLVAFGGSQAVRTLNRAVTEALPGLVERWWLIHLTGDDGKPDADAARQRLPESLRERYRPEAFLGESLLEALAAADLVLGRAGSSTLAEVAALGIPSLVVPYPYAGAHQQANARALVDAGAARLVADEELDGERLLEEVAWFSDPSRRAAMAAAAQALGRPGAAAAVGDLLRALAGHRPLPSQATIGERARAAA